MKKSKTISTIFYSLTAVFLFLLCQFFIPGVREFFQGPILFLGPIIIFSLLGAALLFFTVKQKVKGALRKYLLLTGASSAGFFVFIILHNLFYAFAVISENITILKYILEFLHAGFFLIAVIVCPIGILIGMIGTIILYIKKK